MTGAQSIDAHLFQYPEFPPHGLLMKCRPQAAQVVMLTDTVDFNISAVQEKASVRGELHPAQTHGDLPAVYKRRASIIQFHPQAITCGLIQVPFLQILQHHLQSKAVLSVLSDKPSAPAQVANPGAILPQAVVTPGTLAHGSCVFRLYLHPVAALFLPNMTIHIPRTWLLCLMAGWIPSTAPRLLLPGGMHISAVQGQVHCRTYLQPHIAVDPCAGVPPAVGTLVTNLHQQFVFPLLQIFRDIMIKGRIAILPVPHLLSVDIECTVHVHAVKTEYDPLIRGTAQHTRADAFP